MNFVAQVYAFGVARIGYAGRNTFKCSKRATFMWGNPHMHHGRTVGLYKAKAAWVEHCEIRWAY